ncbi:gustatory receptor 165 [Tribolium castaneum]|uniref:Gustatory receptor n=1 Tax=Tribolium castaneum TaxID=7070 RepID=D6W8K5_TRICA|nr:gustatory receptor 165 [Tribolium castaneum]
MWANPQNLSQVVSPIWTAWKYTGLPVYRFDTVNQKFVSVNTRTYFFGLLILSLVLFLCVQNVFTDDGFVVVNDGINFSQMLILFISNSCTVFLSYRKRKDFSRILSELDLTETRIEKLTKKRISYHADVRKVVLIILATKYGLIATGCLVDCANLVGEEVNMILYYILFSIYFHFEIIIVTYLVVLKRQYREINGYLKSLRVKVLTNYEIREILKVYSVLRQNFTMIKKGFDSIIVVKVIRDIIVTTTGIFFVLETYNVGNTQFLFTTLTNVIWGTTTALTNFLIPVILHDISDQDKFLKLHVAELLHNIKKHLKTFDNQLVLFTIKTVFSKIDLKISGLFSYDCTYITWMIASVTTYVVYLVQFEEPR